MEHIWAERKAVEIVAQHKIHIGKEGEEIEGENYLIGLIKEKLVETREET